MNTTNTPNTEMAHESTLIDSFSRKISYVRLSVTDRCDFRCTYCMAEDMTFLPKTEVLSIEEMTLLCETLVDLGVKKIRLTGGEPLIRRDIIALAKNIGRLKAKKNQYLEELCITTNGSRLETFAAPLKAAGVDRVNISLDTLNPILFKKMTRFGDLYQVLKGIDKALKQNFKKIKINAVILKNHNFDEAKKLIQFVLERNMDISFIEEMPLGKIHSHNRQNEFVSSQALRDHLINDFQLTPSNEVTGGPSRYWKIKNHNNKNSSKIGFISPHSENFCSSCNRIRVNAIGKLLLCLGNEESLDLKKILRQTYAKELIKDNLKKSIINAMILKPEKHRFSLEQEPEILRFMNITGG